MFGARPDWYDQAACAGKGPDAFFPDGRRYDEQSTAAIAVCRTCPVRLDCLQHALNEGEDYGVWGGIDERVRHTYRAGRTRLTHQITS